MSHHIVAQSMAEGAQEYLERQGFDARAIEAVRRRATYMQQDLSNLCTTFKFSDGSSLSLDPSLPPRSRVRVDGTFPICRICNVASVLDAATQSVCESCFQRVASSIWRVNPLVRSLLVQHRIDPGALPAFVPDPEMQARHDKQVEAESAAEKEAQAPRLPTLREMEYWYGLSQTNSKGASDP